jgi:hypothetical protein
MRRIAESISAEPLETRKVTDSTDPSPLADAEGDRDGPPGTAGDAGRQEPAPGA